VAITTVTSGVPSLNPVRVPCGTLVPESHVDISVVVPSHDRPLRLRWLLNALEQQTLAADRWELIVGHDSAGEETDELLRTHPLARKVSVRSVRLPPGSAPPGRNRNAAWRLAQAPVIVFTDDDCRPPADWLERALAAAERHPGAIVQGATGPDTAEEIIGKHAPHVHTQSIWPPQPWAQACNIIYPASVLERTGGFPEDMYVGEDTALAETARAQGVEYVGAREVVTYHAVIELSLLDRLRGVWRWRDLPLLIRRHPRLRQEFPLYVFWKREHAFLPLAVLGWGQMKRRRLAVTLMLPYLVHVVPKKHSQFPRGRTRAALEVPGWTLIYLAEFAALAWGSIKHRKLLL
jgi:glycosyltransferase involved in cell wall biosynthesis